jgi:hypothetical protein
MNLEATILSILGTGGAIFIILKMLLEKSIVAKFDIIKEKEIGSFKAKLDKELEESKHQLDKELEESKHQLEKGLEDTKHQLQLDYAKQNIVFESQKVSFNNIIKIIIKYLYIIENSFDDNKFIFNRIERSLSTDFHNEISNELLFIDLNCYQALQLFEEKIIELFDLSAEEPDQISLDKAAPIYNQLNYISGLILLNFHFIIGLSEDEYLLPDNIDDLKKEVENIK